MIRRITLSTEHLVEATSAPPHHGTHATLPPGTLRHGWWKGGPGFWGHATAGGKHRELADSG